VLPRTLPTSLSKLSFSLHGQIAKRDDVLEEDISPFSSSNFLYK
jgi:hypothetical protein